MKAHIKVIKEVEIKQIIIDLHIRYVGNEDDDDVPTNFPLLKGNQWKAVVMIDSGHILDWPEGEERELYCKVCDQGAYTLIDNEGNELMAMEGYVPHGVVPGDYGDYVDLKIGGDGVIKNWPESPHINDFLSDTEN